MNKKLITRGFLVCFIYLTMSCSNYNHDATSDSNNGDTSLYKVYKIDSINGFYLIYAFKKEVRFKIISKKRVSEAGDTIQKNRSYDFNLTPLLINEFLKAAVVGCIYVDTLTKLCLEEST